MGKRNSGEDGFFHDVKRGIWIYQLRYIDADGNHKRKKFAAKTKHEAMQKGKDFIDSLNRVANDNENLTVGNWIRNWLENYAKPNVRPRTYEKYSGSLKAYILPIFGNVLLSELTADNLQKHFNRLLETGRADGTGLSTSTVRGTRRYLSMCIDDAKLWLNERFILPMLVMSAYVTDPIEYIKNLPLNSAVPIYYRQWWQQHLPAVGNLPFVCPQFLIAPKEG